MLFYTVHRLCGCSFLGTAIGAGALLLSRTVHWRGTSKSPIHISEVTWLLLTEKDVVVDLFCILIIPRYTKQTHSQIVEYSGTALMTAYLIYNAASFPIDLSFIIFRLRLCSLSRPLKMQGLKTRNSNCESASLPSFYLLSIFITSSLPLTMWA